jgi:hypothetical protein
VMGEGLLALQQALELQPQQTQATRLQLGVAGSQGQLEQRRMHCAQAAPARSQQQLLLLRALPPTLLPSAPLMMTRPSGALPRTSLLAAACPSGTRTLTPPVQLLACGGWRLGLGCCGRRPAACCSAALWTAGSTCWGSPPGITPSFLVSR